jgi:lipoprotein-anchoring transpeptidase ErfK/SrfK
MRRIWLCVLALSFGGPASQGSLAPAAMLAQGESGFQVETSTRGSQPLGERFDPSQLALLEKLNRADIDHLPQLAELVVPVSWDAHELAYSVLPRRYPVGHGSPTLLVVHVPGQMFGAYEFGHLVRWGPVSTGRRSSPTPPGRFALNWRSAGRASTVDPEWFLRWYFNFDNREGLAFHAYPLPGHPASHGCVRLLERDAEWLFEWGQPWILDSSGTHVQHPGTPVLLLGRYDSDARPPWRSLAWLSHTVHLPATTLTGPGLTVTP